MNPHEPDTYDPILPASARVGTRVNGRSPVLAWCDATQAWIQVESLRNPTTAVLYALYLSRHEKERQEAINALRTITTWPSIPMCNSAQTIALQGEQGLPSWQKKSLALTLAATIPPLLTLLFWTF